AEAALHGPELQLGDLGQIREAQKVEVDGEDAGPRRAGGGLDGGQVVGVHQGGQVELVVGGVGKGVRRLLDPAVGQGYRAPVHRLGDGVEGFKVVDAHHVVEGLPDDGVEDHQDDQGDE